MCQVYKKCGLYSVSVSYWGMEHKIPDLYRGVKKSIVDNGSNIFTKGGVLMLDPELREVFSRLSQRARNWPKRWGQKYSKTSTMYKITDKTMPAAMNGEDGNPDVGWNSIEKDWNDAVKEFLLRYPSERNRWMKEYIKPEIERIAKENGLDQSFIANALSHINNAYPSHESMRDKFALNLEPHPSMAIFTAEGEEFLDDVEKMGLNIRKKYMEMAKLSSEVLEEEGHLMFLKDITEKVEKIKEQAASQKLIGQSVNATILFLKRQHLKDVYNEAAVCDLLVELREILESSDKFEDLNLPDTSIQIKNKCLQVLKLTTKSFAPIKKEIAAKKKLRRLVKI